MFLIISDLSMSVRFTSSDKFWKVGHFYFGKGIIGCQKTGLEVAMRQSEFSSLGSSNGLSAKVQKVAGSNPGSASWRRGKLVNSVVNDPFFESEKDTAVKGEGCASPFVYCVKVTLKFHYIFTFVFEHVETLIQQYISSLSFTKYNQMGYKVNRKAKKHFLQNARMIREDNVSKGASKKNQENFGKALFG